MASAPRRYEGFLPGRHAIAGFGRGGFRFADISHRGSILALPSGVMAIDIPSPFHHAAALYEPVFVSSAEIDLLIIGAGMSPVPLPETLTWRFRDSAVKADVMTTGAACGTYNLLLAEGRRVAALLCAVD